MVSYFATGHPQYSILLTSQCSVRYWWQSTTSHKQKQSWQRSTSHHMSHNCHMATDEQKYQPGIRMCQGCQKDDTMTATNSVNTSKHLPIDTHAVSNQEPLIHIHPDDILHSAQYILLYHWSKTDLYTPQNINTRTIQYSLYPGPHQTTRNHKYVIARYKIHNSIQQPMIPAPSLSSLDALYAFWNKLQQLPVLLRGLPPKPSSFLCSGQSLTWQPFFEKIRPIALSDQKPWLPWKLADQAQNTCEWSVRIQSLHSEWRTCIQLYSLWKKLKIHEVSKALPISALSMPLSW